MTQNIAVVGAGIAGMCTALALARKNFNVILFERDTPPPQGDPDQAFFAWQRRGAAQFRHPHAFLGLMCNLLEENYPELLEDFFTAGARRLNFTDMVPPALLSQYQEQPGDEKLWLLMCRRATMETVLRRYVDKQPCIQIKNTTYVTGIQTKRDNGTVAVSGLELTDRLDNNAKSVYQADAYIDASGRTSKFSQWLGAIGVDISEQHDDAEIVYYTRHYKLNEGTAEPSRHDNEPAAGDLGYLKYGVFPGDGGHFAIIICLPNAETELRAAVKNGDYFDSICRTIPGLQPWVNEQVSHATTDTFGIGEIHAVWRDWVSQDKPDVLNFFAVGDSSARTNPLYGRGCSIGILHAHLLADVLAGNRDATQRAQAFNKLTQERIRPIFDASLREDKSGIKRADAVKKGLDKDTANSIKSWFRLALGDALAAAVRDQLHVFRGMMRTFN
ncbi:MAG: FAD-dependent oxidoreductase, partial [Gammaproteobacteria bacterium]|nr:FAD-dependent oxidoreductase [Gammaproteobacteria bacterium]